MTSRSGYSSAAIIFYWLVILLLNFENNGKFTIKKTIFSDFKVVITGTYTDVLEFLIIFASEIDVYFSPRKDLHLQLWAP